MNSNSTKKILSLVLLVLIAVFALSFTACDNSGDPSTNNPPLGGSTVTEIYIEKSKMPRQLYVEGQSLELKGGVLTTVIDGQPAPIPLDSEGVTVSGYDMNVVGNQTVTVTYKEKTTTFPITVIARAVAENYEANYFVGDAFNKAKGKLRLAKDNAETFVVNMNDPTVTVKSFDSTAAGEHSVTVSCVKEGVTYECSFKVTFHEPAEIKFVAPKKLSYSSTDAQLNLTGGYLTVKAAAPSKLTKSVPLTQDMVSGYDPAALTLENRYESVKQKITVSYAGQTWEYTVSVSFSGLSVVNELAKQLTDLAWEQDELPKLTEAQQLAAIDAMEVYLDLAPADQEQVSEATLVSIIRAAAVGAQELYAVELNSLADAFVLDFSSGALMMLGKTYEAIEHAAERLSNENDGFNRYSAVLRAIGKSYGTVKLTKDYAISNYVVTHAEAANETIVPMLEHMLNVYDTMKDIPADWDLDTLKEYEMDILDTVNIILLSEYKGNNFMALYNPITNWRADFFEIIYTYYYEIKEGGKNDIQTKLWGSIPAPGLVYSWYTTFMSAYNEAYLMAQNTESGKAILYDTTKFFYYYAETMKLVEQIKTEGTPMDKGIYELLNGDYMNEAFLRRTSSGYLALMTGALNDEAIADLWDTYLAIYEKYTKVTNQEQYTAFLTDNKPAMQVMFAKLTALTPAQIHAFLSSLNYLYDNTRGALPLFDYSQNGATSVFVACVVSTCMSSTPESTRVILQNMFLATEYYSLRNQNEKALGNFTLAMEAIITALGELDDADETAFLEAYGIENWFNNYKAIYDVIKDQSKLTVSDTVNAKLNELNALLDRYDELLNVISSTDTSTDEGKMRVNLAYPLLFAISDKIEAAKNELLAMDGAYLAYIAKEYVIMDGEEEIRYTAEMRYNSAKVITVRFMLANGMGDDLVWDIHNVNGVAALLAELYDMMNAEFNGVVYEGDVKAMMALFKATTAETKYAFFQLQGTQLFYGAIERYMKTQLPAELVETGILKQMLDAEIYYWVYQYNTEDLEALRTFRTNMESVMATLEDLDDTSAFDTALGDLYDFYAAEYETVKDIVLPEPEEPKEEPAA